MLSRTRENAVHVRLVQENNLHILPETGETGVPSLVGMENAIQHFTRNRGKPGKTGVRPETERPVRHEIFPGTGEKVLWPQMTTRTDAE